MLASALRWSMLLIAAVLAQASGANAAGQQPRTVAVVYVSREESAPPRSSLLQPANARYGEEGAEFGLQEINNSGRFLDVQYRLIKVIVPAGADMAAAVSRTLADRQLVIVADLQGRDLLQLADLPAARDALILDARTSDDSLREADCRANVFHILPSWAMRADALGQYLTMKSWKRWFLLRGTDGSDQEFAAAIKRSARRFGATIVTEKTFDLRGEARDETAGRQQIQAQIAGVTKVEAPYDLLLVADTASSFGDYLLFNTAAPRLVAGTHGMVAEAWDPQFEQYAARGVLLRFYRAESREMTERDYGNSVAMAVIAEAVTRGRSTDAPSMKAYLLSNRFSVAANKGEGLTFRSWNQQLRQPLLLFGPRVLVSMAPLSQYQHAKFQTDTLGIDEQESQCRRIHPEASSNPAGGG
jgi:ABC transporter substrate binding protein (PQQ-dependent alcohol dehydrogenase system)